jgi:hypothetical protein
LGFTSLLDEKSLGLTLTAEELATVPLPELTAGTLPDCLRLSRAAEIEDVRIDLPAMPIISALKSIHSDSLN